MCLGIPGRIITIAGNVAVVESWGARHKASLVTMSEPVCPGDFIIAHLGVAVRKIPSDSIAETMAMYEIVLPEAGGDPFARPTFPEVDRSLVLAQA